MITPTVVWKFTTTIVTLCKYFSINIEITCTSNPYHPSDCGLLGYNNAVLYVGITVFLIFKIALYLKIRAACSCKTLVQGYTTRRAHPAHSRDMSISVLPYQYMEFRIAPKGSVPMANHLTYWECLRPGAIYCHAGHEWDMFQLAKCLVDSIFCTTQ